MKAVRIWRSLDEAGQASLVATCLERTGLIPIAAHWLAAGAGDPLTALTGATPG